MQHKIDICDELRQGRRYIINGKIEKVVRLIPMQDKDGKIYDVEVLIDKKKNRYFSWNTFMEGKSWVKAIYEIPKGKTIRDLVNEFNEQVKKMEELNG